MPMVSTPPSGGPGPPDRTRRSGPLREKLLRDDFTGPSLDERRWLAHYLPHWTTPDRSAARYEFVEDGLRLRIDHDQPAWREEDGPMRVSNLQTGSDARWAAAVASTGTVRTG